MSLVVYSCTVGSLLRCGVVGRRPDSRERFITCIDGGWDALDDDVRLSSPRELRYLFTSTLNPFP